MTISQQALEALVEAEMTMLPLSNHPLADGDVIAELAPLGLVTAEDETGRWYAITDAGYSVLEDAGVRVTRWFPQEIAAWTR